MLVKLDYFKPDTGAWHGRSEFESQLFALHQAISEVKWLKQRHELPGLEAGHDDVTVLITVEGQGMHMLPGIAIQEPLPVAEALAARGYHQHKCSRCSNPFYSAFSAEQFKQSVLDEPFLCGSCRFTRREQ